MAGGGTLQEPEIITKAWWESDFTLNPDVLDGYPSFAELGNFKDNTMDSKYNFTSHVQDLNGYPSLRLGPIVDSNFNSHYVFATGTDYLNGYPSLQQEYVNIIDDFLIYSKYVFSHQPDNTYIDGYPTLGQQDFEHFGVAKDCTLEEVVIPKSVIFIADWAFYNSNITSVKINRHCVYYPHSFPPGCHIKPYNDEG